MLANLNSLNIQSIGIKQPELGYYSTGNKLFRSKIEACIYATKHNLDVEWNFNNAEFSRFDWSIEPTETLDNLYQLRAKQLREQYDYIALMYSAGSDSHNILQSFLNQNLYVDELIVIHTSDGAKQVKTPTFEDKSAVNGSYSEHVLQTIPRLNEIALKYPQIKITVKDMTSNILDTYIKGLDGSWVENRVEWLNPVGGSRWNFNYLTDFKNTLDKGKNVCLLVGVEKPRTFFDNDDNYFIVFNDRATTFGPAQHLTDYTNMNIEYFYWHPDCCKMLSKQAHIVKRFIETKTEYQESWKTPLTWEKIQYVHEPVLRNLIYTTWDENVFYQADKPSGDWRIQYDEWFFSNKDSSIVKSVEIWNRGVDYITRNASKFIIYNNGVPDGLKKYFFKYKVGKLNRPTL